jgi:hypothetical protein
MNQAFLGGEHTPPLVRKDTPMDLEGRHHVLGRAFEGRQLI